MFPLLWLSSAFLLGLILASRVTLPWTVWLEIAAACLPLAFFERRLARRFEFLDRLARLPVPLALALASLCFGAARYQYTRPIVNACALAYYNDRGEYLVRGWIDEYPQISDSRARLTLQVEEIVPLIDGQPGGEAMEVSGRLLANLPWTDRWQYGDRLELRGKLETPPEGESFSYREFLARQSVFSFMNSYAKPKRTGHGAGSPVLAILYGWRERAYQVANRIFPQPEAALLNGILLGLDQDIPAALQRAYQVTGTAHVIAISGFNISILALLFYKLFGRFLLRWWAALLTVIAITAYALLAGGEPPVARAAFMAALVLFGRELGRASSGLNTLAFSAAVLSFFQPDLPWEASFQLSFAATLGLVLYADRFDGWFRALAGRFLSAERVERLAGPVGEFLLVTLAAQVTTLPVLVYHFQRVSLSALLSNPLALPPQPLVMVLSGIAVFAGMVWLPLGQLLGYLAWPFAAYTNRVVELLARIPGGSIPVPDVSPALVLVFYAVLFALTFAGAKSRLKAVLRPGLAFAITGTAAVLAWQGVQSRPDGKLHLVVSNLGGEASLLVITPAGRALVINGGEPSGLDLVGKRLSLFDRRLDGLILARPSGKNWSGLAAFTQRYPPGWVAAMDSAWETKTGETLERGLVDAGVETMPLETGTAWDLGGGARLEVARATEDGAALVISYGSFRALMPNGAAVENIPLALRSGSVPVLGEEDMKAGIWQNAQAQAVLLVLPGGIKLPDEWNGRPVVNIEPGGWVEASSDGNAMWVETGR